MLELLRTKCLSTRDRRTICSNKPCHQANVSAPWDALPANLTPLSCDHVYRRFTSAVPQPTPQPLRQPSGFHKQRFTASALLPLVHKVVVALNKLRPCPLRTVAMPMNLTKAFVTVNHTKLLAALSTTSFPYNFIR